MLSAVRAVAQNPSYPVIPIAVQSLGYAPDLGLLFATTTATSSQHPAALVAIRAGSAQVEWWVPLGGDPASLSISAGERYVYVWNRTDRAVQRISTETRAVDLTIPSPIQQSSSGSLHARMAALPGNAESFAITVYTGNSDGGVWIVDGANPRSISAGGSFAGRTTHLVVNDEGNRIYGYAGGTTGFELMEFEVAGDGVRLLRTRRGVFSGFGGGLRFSKGKLYNNSGTAVRASSLHPDGRFFQHPGIAATLPAYRSEDGLLYFAETRGSTPREIRAYHPDTYLLAKRLVFWPPRTLGPYLESCGEFIASAGPDGVLLLRADDIPPVPDTPFPQPVDIGGVRSVALFANDVVYSPHHHRVYATVANAAGKYGNSIAELDPQSGAVLRTQFVGSDPAQIALSDDGQFLYVSLHGTASLVRLNLPSLDNPVEYPIEMPNPTLGILATPRFPGSLAVAPGHPHRIAFLAGEAVTQNVDAEMTGSVGLVDGGVARMRHEVGHIAGQIAFGGHPDRIYVTKSVLGSTGIHEYAVVGGEASPVLGSSTGVTNASSAPTASMSWQDGRLYFFSGAVINPGVWTLDGTFPATGLALPDLARNQVHFLTSFGGHALVSFDAETYTLQSARSLPTTGAEPRDLIAVGPETFAYRTVAGGVHFVRRDSITPVPPSPPPAPRTEGPLRKLSLPMLDIAEDPISGDVLATVPGFSAVHPNSVVHIHPGTGEVKSAFRAGSDPQRLAVATDGKALYVSLAGSAGITTIDLETKASKGIVRLGSIDQIPEEIAVHPLEPGIAAVATTQAIYELRNFATQHQHLRNLAYYASPVYRSDGKQLLGIHQNHSTGAALLAIDLENRANPTDVRYSPYKPSSNYVGGRIFPGAGLLVDEWGTVVDAASLSFIAQLHPDRPSRALYAVSAERNRIIGLESNVSGSGLTLYAYDLQSFVLRETASLSFTERVPLERFILLGGGRFAILTGPPNSGGSRQLSLGSLDLLTPLPSAPKPSAESPEPDVLHIPLSVTTMAYHPGTGRLFAALPESASWSPGSIVSIDPANGNLSEPLATTTSPTRMELDTSTDSIVLAENLGTVLRWLSPETGGTRYRLELGYNDGIFTNIVPKRIQRNLRALWDFDVLPNGQGVAVSTEVARGYVDQGAGIVLVREGNILSEYVHSPGVNRVFLSVDSGTGSLLGVSSTSLLRLQTSGDRIQLQSQATGFPSVIQMPGRPAFGVEGSTAYLQYSAINLTTRQTVKTINPFPLRDEKLYLDLPARRLVAAGREPAGSDWDLVVRVYDLDTGIPLARKVLGTFGRFPAEESLTLVDLVPCGSNCVAVSADITQTWPARSTRSSLFLIRGLYSGAMPAMESGGIVNAASFQRSIGVSPGEILSLFGSNLGPEPGVSLRLEGGRVTNELGGTGVLIDGVPMPLLYVGRSQVNVIVPYSAPGGKNSEIVVETPGGRSTPLLVYVLAGPLGLFSRDATGKGQAAVLNQDYSINSPENPARRGEVIMVYGTGGPMPDRDVEAGALATSDLWRIREPATATVGGQTSVVEYAGAAPGLVNGVKQFNVRIPAVVTPGPNVPIIISSGGESSQSNVTIAVKE